MDSAELRHWIEVLVMGFMFGAVAWACGAALAGGAWL